MMSHLRAGLTIFVLLTLVTGVAYPLVITLIAQGIFPHQANGSIIERDGKPGGSELIGQTFDNPRYFWSRPSATITSVASIACSTFRRSPFCSSLLASESFSISSRSCCLSPEACSTDISNQKQSANCFPSIVANIATITTASGDY